MTFATYDPSSNTLESLAAAIFSGSASATLVNGSVSALFGTPPDEASTISYYDGSNVTDPATAGLRFDVVFGSDEYPEFSNTNYVDVAAVYVNGVNYALFNNNPTTRLSVIAPNVNSGNFRDNTSGIIPIDHAPDKVTLSSWVAKLDLKPGGNDVAAVAQDMINTYHPGLSNQALIGQFYQNIVGVAPSPEVVAQLASQVGAGHTFASIGEMLAFGAMLSQNTQEIVGIVGSIQALDASLF